MIKIKKTIKNKKEKIIFATVICFLAIVPLVIAICNDNPSANLHTGNSGTYDGSLLSSSCVDNHTLFFPYCVGADFDFRIHSCPCNEGKGIATHYDVFNWIKYMGEEDEGLRAGVVTEGLLYDGIESWVNN